MRQQTLMCYILHSYSKYVRNQLQWMLMISLHVLNAMSPCNWFLFSRPVKDMSFGADVWKQQRTAIGFHRRYIQPTILIQCLAFCEAQVSVCRGESRVHRVGHGASSYCACRSWLKVMNSYGDNTEQSVADGRQRTAILILSTNSLIRSVHTTPEFASDVFSWKRIWVFGLNKRRRISRIGEWRPNYFLKKDSAP
jgi:hypothetical protein